MQPTMSVNPSRSASPAMTSASVKPPVLSSLMLTASYLPTSAGSETRPCTLSSAQIASGRAMRASASSLAAGNGCSTSVTPACAQAARFVARSSAVQPSLASTMSSARGDARRTAAMRAGSPGAPSLTLSSARSAAAAAACAIASGVASEIVKAVVTGLGAARPRSSCTGRAARLAARSQNAQSSALRAAPPAMADCRRSRSSPRAMSGAIASIAAATPSTVSP